MNTTRRLCLVLLVASGGLAAQLAEKGQYLPNLFPFPNATGLLETYNVTGGPINLSGPFFQSLGTNGRSCSSCHRPAQGWSISSNEVRLRFELTQGQDPIFRTVDGSNCGDTVDTTTISGRREAYSLLLNRGLIRIELAVPSNAEFDVVGVENPYGCNDASALSVYRRPLPSTNLRFLSTVMWDGRESSPQTGTQKITFETNPADLLANLAHQALDATNGHAQASVALTEEQQKAIVDFEMGLVTAQAFDYRAGSLNAGDANGGPKFLGQQTMPDFFVGINDPLGENPRNLPFTPVIFNLFDSWLRNCFGNHGFSEQQEARRESIARGQELFNSKAINIVGVAGLNDDLNLPSIPGTCGTCHDSPNVGNHSVSAPLDIGVADPDSSLGVSYLPVFTLQNKTTFEIKKTTDPGRALITGAWKDIGRVKGPILHGLSSRAPYFHNGSARTLEDVLDFYENRFNIGLTAQEKEDLIAFLSAL
jgi:cytochrome c peroxidase